MISFDEFKKVELTVGKILSAERVPDTDKLLKLAVDFGQKGSTSPGTGEVEPFGNQDIRQIISGIASHFPDPAALVGRKFLFVTNIPPRAVRGLESDGMILAVSTGDGKFSLFEPSDDIPEGTTAR